LNGSPDNADADTGPRPVEWNLVAHAAVRVPLAAVAELRRRPGPPGVADLPANFLKHADEQTVAGLSALLYAVADHGLTGTAFTDWGVLAAPRLLARSTMIASLQRFIAEGAWGVSPHMIPHRTLHSVSGTVSPALKIHGPNLGVGGGPGGAVEVLLAAAGLLTRARAPGLWVVWTAAEPEGELDLAGRGDPDKHCRALAVGLTPPPFAPTGLRLRLEVTPRRSRESGEGRPLHYFYFEELLQQVGAGGRADRDLEGGFRVTLERAAAANGPAGRPRPTPFAPGSHPPAVAEVQR
jgi:hypothetical protein